MKLFICLLLLASTILTISTATETVLLLSGKNHHINPTTDGNLHYYRKYRDTSSHLPGHSKADKDTPASTFHERQKLRDQAFKAKRHILEANKEMHDADLKQRHVVESLENKLEEIKKHFVGLFEKQNEIDQGLKIKINHVERFREVYASRASENLVLAGAEMDPKIKLQKKDLANWDTKQSDHYAEKAAGYLRSLKDGEKRVANLNRIKSHDVEVAEDNVLQARAKEESDKSKGQGRLEALKAKELKLNKSIQEGKWEGQAADAEKKNKEAAQTVKIEGLVPRNKW